MWGIDFAQGWVHTVGVAIGHGGRYARNKGKQMAKMYHTVCVWDADANCWFDAFGSYSKAECREEMSELRDSGTKAKHVKIITHEDTAAAMIAARDALPQG